CMVLPPVIDTGSLDSDSYFHEKRVDLRAAIAANCNIVQPAKGEPLAVRVWRFYHDELMTDLFREGALGKVEVTDGKPATLLVGLVKGSNHVASWRRQFLLNPLCVPGPPWAREVAGAIVDDVRDAAIGIDDADLSISLEASTQKAISEQIPVLPTFMP